MYNQVYLKLTGKLPLKNNKGKQVERKMFPSFFLPHANIFFFLIVIVTQKNEGLLMICY